MHNSFEACVQQLTGLHRPNVSDGEGPADGRTEEGTGQTGDCFTSVSDCFGSGNK